MNFRLYAVLAMLVSKCLGSQSPPILTFPDFHNGAVTSMALGAKNQWLLTAGMDGRAMIFDLKNRLLIRQFKGHLEAITGASFAWNDTRVVTSSFDGKLMVWDVKTGKRLREWNALSGHVPDSKNAWNRNPLFPPFCSDSAGKCLVFYATSSNDSVANRNLNQKPKLVFYDVIRDSVMWSMPVNGFDKEGRPFSLGMGGEWLLLTDYARNPATGMDNPFIRLIYTVDTALQYRWWGNEACFDEKEIVICNGHNILRFNPSYESAVVKNINGGYGYFKSFCGTNKLLMQCLQQQEAGNVAARNFNVKNPFKTPEDSILYYLSGSREMKLPYWRVADLKSQQTHTVRIHGDSSASWQPVYRINEALSSRGLIAFTKAYQKFAFVELQTGKTILMNFFNGTSYPKSAIPIPDKPGKWLISLEHEPSNRHEFALYELNLDFNKIEYTLSEFLSSSILNQSLSFEDDNQMLPDLIIFPDGNRVLSSDKSGNVRIADYSTASVKEKLVSWPDAKTMFGPAAVNASGSLIRCYSGFNQIYTFSSKTGQPQAGKKTDKWRLLPDQTLFNTSMVCFDADSLWKVEHSRGKALVTERNTGKTILIYVDGSPMADFQVVKNRFLVGMGNDGGMSVYSLESGQLLFTQYLFKDGGNLLITPDGRVEANEKAKQKIYGVDGMNIIPLAGTSQHSESGIRFVEGLRKQLLR